MTDINLWQAVAGGTRDTEQWKARAQLIAHFIRPDDVVLDLGAGDQKLSRYLPPSCGYIPVDCVGDLPNTFVVDFNREFRLPDGKFNVIVSAGFIEYIKDLPRLLSKLAAAAHGCLFLFTYSYTPLRAQRSSKPWRKLNAFHDAASITQAVSPYVGSLREIARLKKQSLFMGSIGSNIANSQLPLINDLISRPPMLGWKWTG